MRDSSKPISKSKMNADRSPKRRDKSRAAKTQYDNKVQPARDLSKPLAESTDLSKYEKLSIADVRRVIRKSLKASRK
jgi:hypothetical protein